MASGGLGSAWSRRRVRARDSRKMLGDQSLPHLISQRGAKSKQWAVAETPRSEGMPDERF